MLFFLKTASDGLKWVICLTFSHDSVGCSTRWNRISAKAGCFSIALQLKLRLFFAQDMEMFCGASYLTVEQKVVFFYTILCMCLHLFTIFVLTLQQKQKKQALVCSQLTCSAVCFSEMNGASFTCLPKFNRPPGWRAAGLSFVSYYPNVDWTMLDKHFLVDLSTGLLKAPKFFFIGWICRALTAIKTSWERLTSSRC